MKANKDFILRQVAGEYILIPTGETAIKIHGMMSLTESGKLLWNKLQEDTTFEELVQTILGEYDIDQETAENDVREFLGKLKQLKVLEDL